MTEKQIIDGIIDENYINLIKFEMDRADRYYEEAFDGPLFLLLLFKKTGALYETLETASTNLL